MNRLKAITIALGVLLLSACASNYSIKVDSIAESGAKPGAKYVLASGMNDVGENDLYFREFAAPFRKILAAKGFTEVEKRADADIEILLSYGSSSGRAEFYTYTRPIYHVSGGDAVRYKEIKTDASGNKTETTGTFYVPMRTQVVGYTTELNSQTIYTNYVVLDAVTAVEDEKDRKPVWKTTLRLADTTNDLRHLIPYLAEAGAPYVGTNTGAIITVNLPKSAPPAPPAPK